jgi:diguanylate cyclase (GGDEF)-like protein
MRAAAASVTFPAGRATSERRRPALRKEGSLKLRLVVGLLVVAVAPFLLMAWSVTRNAEASYSEKLDAQSLLALQTGATRLNSKLFSKEESVHTLASQIASQIGRAKPATLAAELPTDSKLRLASGRSIGSLPEGSLTRSVTIRSSSGKPVGVLTQSLPLDQSLLRELVVGAPVADTILVVSEHGRVTDGPAALVGSPVARQGDATLGGRTYRIFSTQVDEGRRLHVLSPEDELRAQMHSLQTKLLLSGVGVLAALLVLLFVIAGPLVSSLRTLSRTARSASIDALTQLANRGAFERTLADELTRADRYQHPLSLVVLDLDKFKQLNDTYGHPAGDEALRQLARVLETNLREHDTAARVGGEEFALILPETSLEGAHLLAERMRMAVQALNFDTGGHTLRVTASFGVADTSGGHDAAALYRAADGALYRSKQEGRNRVGVAAPPLPLSA